MCAAKERDREREMCTLIMYNRKIWFALNWIEKTANKAYSLFPIQFKYLWWWWKTICLLFFLFQLFRIAFCFPFKLQLKCKAEQKAQLTHFDAQTTFGMCDFKSDLCRGFQNETPFIDNNISSGRNLCFFFSFLWVKTIGSSALDNSFQFDYEVSFHLVSAIWNANACTSVQCVPREREWLCDDTMHGLKIMQSFETVFMGEARSTIT